ncbi:hypothetical protein ASPCAL11782 [Aspergillus calidoustus]|uniref:Uncharacterized protein n=1 Tax=Aspergillus calidoustus TaxID=454130 RepID=A0A0U5CEX6_ASPCI|nr:hypothetical protein ASPCAL11782 [Aspergillus calidoustus]
MLDGDASAKNIPLSIEPKTLPCLTRMAGLDEAMMNDFLRYRLPHLKIQVQYNEETDKPEFISIFLRCPRNSRCVMGIIKLELATRNCLAILSTVLAQDMQDIWTQCIANTGLLKTHPLHLIAFIYEQRFQSWADWTGGLWNQVAEIETATNMVPPMWKMEVAAPRLQSLSVSGSLLKELHATNVQLSHCDFVVASGMRFGQSCLDLVSQVERIREEKLGFDPMPVRHRAALDTRMRYTLDQCGALAGKLSEVRNRLGGQMEVSYSLVAQKNSMVNLAVAEQQARDSRTVKAIAVLTLSCLPSTLVATLWTAGLFHLEGDRNWQIYLVVSLVLTLAVLVLWRIYVFVSERPGKQENRSQREYDLVC